MKKNELQDLLQRYDRLNTLIGQINGLQLMHYVGTSADPSIVYMTFTDEQVKSIRSSIRKSLSIEFETATRKLQKAGVTFD